MINKHAIFVLALQVGSDMSLCSVVCGLVQMCPCVACRLVQMCPCVADWFSCVLVLQAGSSLPLYCRLVQVCLCCGLVQMCPCVASWLRCVLLLQVG